MTGKTNRRWSATVVVVLAVVASSLVQAPHADAAKARPKCLGKKATIVGNKRANTLKGTKKADVIVGLGGNDRINGRGGADRICGGAGKDKIFGGGGNDRMDGGKGNDECRQQAGTGPKKNCEGPKYQLTVSKAGSGTGTITSSPTGIDCGLTCSLSVVEGDSVSLTAAAASGSTFSGWAGACTGTSGCSVVISKAQSVIATFTANPAPPPPPSFSLAVTTSGTGSGTISSSPGGINCGSDCSEVYTQGTSVTLSVTSSTGSVFDGWSGACSGTGSCALSMDAAKSANASFTAVSYNLHVDRVLTGTGASGTVTSAPTGINCGTDCDEIYGHGTAITLTATAGSGSIFSSWSGCDSGTGNPCSINLTGARTATATFVKVWPLDVTKDGGTGFGTVTSSPSGINCGATCSANFEEGSSVTLTPTPISGSRFDSWSGCDSTPGNQCIVTMTGARSVNAVFVKFWGLTVTKSGSGSGTVSSSPSGIDCGATCSANFDQGTSVVLTGTAAAGSRFGSWSGCDSSSGNQCTVNMTAAKSVTATFIKQWDLSVSRDGTGSGSVLSSPSGINCGSDCTETYDQGTSVTLTASPAAGSRFGSWSGCDSSSGSQCTVDMMSAESVTATFIKLWDLTVNKAGSGSGTVTSSPSGIDCGSDCTETYDQGTSVTLTASPAAGSRFGSWSGCDSSSGSQCTVDMMSAESVTATFIKIWDLTVTLSGSGGGSVASNPSGIDCGSDCTETYDQGTSVVLTGTAASGSRFGSWSGCDSTAGNQCTVNVNSVESVTANFIKVWDLTVTKTGSGTGSVTSVPSGINCGATCTAAFDQGESVTLTAAADSGSVFTGWGGDCSGTDSCVLTMNAAKSVTANFTPGRVLTVTKSGTGGGTVTSNPTGIDCGGDCTQTYLDGASVVLTATPDGTSTFTSWTNCDSPSGNQCTMTMSADKTVNAQFTRITYNLHVDRTLTGGASGSVTSSPAGITCGADCDQVYDSGTPVDLTASADAGSRFVSWSGCDSVAGSVCTVNMTSARTATATFIKTWTLTVTTNGAVQGTVQSDPAGINCDPDCTFDFDHNTSVTLTRSGGGVFTGWGGACSGNGTTCVVTMDNAKNVTATWL